MIQPILDAEAKSLKLTIDGDLLYTNTALTHFDIPAVFESEAAKSGFWTTLTLDLTAATKIDSVGLNFIVMLNKQAKQNQAKTVVVINHMDVMRVFSFTRLDAHVEIVFVG